MKKFSSNELYELRNAISVDILIQDVLHIPSKISEGFFRFMCPICNEFQTSVNPNTNLSRCFLCEKNFNTIDLVMRNQGRGFRASVLFLKQLLQKVPNHNKNTKQVCNDLASGISKPLTER